MPQEQVVCTNSRGLIWRSEDGSEGSFKNNEQKAVAVVGQPPVGKDLVEIIEYFKQIEVNPAPEIDKPLRSNQLSDVVNEWYANSI